MRLQNTEDGPHNFDLAFLELQLELRNAVVFVQKRQTYPNPFFQAEPKPKTKATFPETKNQKNPRVRKILVRDSGAGNGCANFMGAWKNAFFLQETSMSMKFLV